MAKLKEVCSSEMQSSLNIQTEVKENREKQFLNTFPKSDNTKSDNTVCIKYQSHNKTRREPRFCKQQKILFLHLHEDLDIPGRSWKFVNLGVTIQLPDQFIYIISYLTSFLTSKGLSVVPITYRTGQIVPLIVEVHNISKYNLKVHRDTTFLEIRFMTHYNIEISKWDESYSAKVSNNSIQEETQYQETAV